MKKMFTLKRKWALVGAILLTIAALMQFAKMDFNFGALNFEKALGLFGLPAVLYYLAFAGTDAPDKGAKK